MRNAEREGASVEADGRPVTRRDVLVVPIVLALALLAFAPRAAGTLVTLVDSVSERQARVDRTGSLTVSTRPANANAWRAFRRGAGPLFAPPATAGGPVTLLVGSITITNGTASPTALSLVVIAPCSPNAGFGSVVSEVVVQPNATLHLDFPEPLPLSAPRPDWCLDVQGDPALPRAITTTGVGYSRL